MGGVPLNHCTTDMGDFTILDLAAILDLLAILDFQKKKKNFQINFLFLEKPWVLLQRRLRNCVSVQME